VLSWCVCLVPPASQHPCPHPHPLLQPPQVRQGASYSQETRKIILSLERIRKVAPNGKEVLNNVSLGMYLGAKVGVLVGC